jgi:hypothetical protein
MIGLLVGVLYEIWYYFGYCAGYRKQALLDNIDWDVRC